MKDLFDNRPKVGWSGWAARRQTEERANDYLEYLEHRIQLNDCVQGTQICLKKGRVEGVGRTYNRHETLPTAVVVRVDNKRSFVYNIKNSTRTVSVPTEMALATVRFINGGHYEQPGTS